MFVGTYEHRIDMKGRLVLPSRFRQELGDCVVVAMGMGSYVSLYTPLEWEHLLGKLQNVPPSSGSRARDLCRVLLATANEVLFDAAGRVLLPPLLREKAVLEQDVVVVGQRNHVEIWDRERWSSYQASVFQDFFNIAQEIEDL